MLVFQWRSRKTCVLRCTEFAGALRRTLTSSPANPMTSLAPVKLLLVVPAYFPDSYGGAERQALILSEALGATGVDVTLVAPTTSKTAPLLEVTSFGRIERCRVKAYPNLGGRHFLDFLKWTLWFYWRYSGQSHRGSSIYIFHSRLHAFGPVLAGMRRNSRILVKLGGGGGASEFDALRSKKYFYGKWIEKLLLKRVNKFVSNSRQITDELLLLGVPDARIAQFHNGVVVPDDKIIDASLHLRTGASFIYAGRLREDKRPQVLYDAALALLKAGKFNPTLVLLGDGPEAERLANLETTKKYLNNFEFPGFKGDVYPNLLRCDFFLSASMREGQSNALLEAMSAGLIPVVYAASGVKDVITHGVNGFIVPQSSPSAFIEAMTVAMCLDRNERVRMATKAREFAKSHISIDRIASLTLDLLQHDGQGQS